MSFHSQGRHEVAIFELTHKAMSAQLTRRLATNTSEMSIAYFAVSGSILLNYGDTWHACIANG